MGNTEMQRAWMWQTMLAAVGTYDQVQTDSLGRDRTSSKPFQFMTPARARQIAETGSKRDPHVLPRGPVHVRKFTT
jgi:hypothetical protein